jgi:glycosyltransferase involved in cell wall biosynthesis
MREHGGPTARAGVGLTGADTLSLHARTEARVSKRPVVSIVLATNRNSPFIRETLRSVRQQTLDSWELVIVDNGIPVPEDIAFLIGDDVRMSLIQVNPDATAGMSRNIGASLAQGEFVTFLDDDDVWHPERLDQHVQAHRERPAAPATYSGYWHMDAEGNRFGIDWRSRTSRAEDVLRGVVHTPLGPTLVVRLADFHAIGGFSPEIPILVDFEFGLRLALRGDLVYIDELLLGYRRHSGNMTSTASENVRLRRHVMEEMIERQRWSAAGRRNDHVAQLFEERLGSFRAQQAREIGENLPRLIREQDFAGAARDFAWAASRSPRAMLDGVRTRLQRVIRR